MKEILKYLFFCLLSAAWMNPSILHAESSLLLDSEAIEKHLKSIIQYGPRPSGSRALISTRQYILKQLKQTGAIVKTYPFKAGTPAGKVSMVNLYAQLKGNSDKLVVFACHYESKLFRDFAFLGANDALSSVALLLEMAAYYSKQKPAYTIGFLFLDGEESFGEWSDEDSLYGSRHQAVLWTKEKKQDKVEALILLDMVGDKNPVFCRELNSTKSLTDRLWNFAAKKNLTRWFSDCANSVTDDHVPFLRAGFRAIDIIHTPFPYYWHTAQDTEDKISYSNLNLLGSFLIEFIENL